MRKIFSSSRTVDVVSGQHQQRGLVALTRAQNAVEEYIGEELEKEFQRGVERGAFEQRVADRARATNDGNPYECLHGVGREWAQRRANQLADDYLRHFGLHEHGTMLVELKKFFLKAMGFEDAP